MTIESMGVTPPLIGDRGTVHINTNKIAQHTVKDSNDSSARGKTAYCQLQTGNVLDP